MGGRRRPRRARVVQQRWLLRVVPEHRHLVLRRLRGNVPADPVRTVDDAVEREYFWHPSVPPERRDADLAATRVVVEQDLTMCETVQGTYDAGLSANGVLSTEHENGVAHMHQLLFAALR